MLKYCHSQIFRHNHHPAEQISQIKNKKVEPHSTWPQSFIGISIDELFFFGSLLIDELNPDATSEQSRL